MAKMDREILEELDQPAVTPYGNPWALPGVLEAEPSVPVAVRYSVKLPSGARYTVCAPASAVDVASMFPRSHYRERGGFNHGERTGPRLGREES